MSGSEERGADRSPGSFACVPAAAVHRHPFVSTTLGMGQFPVGTEQSRISPDDDGDHVMGATVIAWLTGFPIEEWGQSWATQGAFEIRFRSHLTAGLALAITVETTADSMTFTVADAGNGGGEVFATATASRFGAATPSALDSPPVPAEKAEPSDDQLRDRVLIPVRFRFDAARDLAFDAPMVDSSFWVERGWAHPAWMASAANAIIRRNVDFPSPGHWLHAGLRLSMHAPIDDGSVIDLTGRIDELFGGRRHRFAVAALEASVAGRPVMSMRNTFAYAPR